MRKSYVSISELGTSSQNPKHSPGPESFVPPFTKGKTSITDIESMYDGELDPASEPEPVVVKPVKPRRVKKQVLNQRDEPTCRDIAMHTKSCPVCSKLYKQDLLFPIIIFSIMSAIIIILILKLNSK